MSEVDFRQQLLKLSQKLQEQDVNQEIFNKLESFYSINSRHEYSQLSEFVFYQQDEQNEILDYNILVLIDIAEDQDSSYLNNFRKLQDHLKLSIGQKKFIEDNLKTATEAFSDAINNANNAVTDARHMIENVRQDSEKQTQKLESIEQRSKKITSDFVSILGIFSSVIFAAFGGLEILKNILGNIANVPTGKLLVFSSLTIGAIIFLVFLLLNGLAKLTSLNLRSCNCSSNEVCRCNIVKKHPSIVIIYIILFIFLFIGLTSYIVNYSSLFNDIINSWKSWFKLLIIFILLSSISTTFIIWFKKMKNA